jgi:hypothetical protein
VIEPLRQPDRRQLVARAAEGLGVAREFQRNGDVLQRRHGRDEVERLKDNSDMAAAKACERVLANRLAAPYIQIDVVEDMNPRGSMAER